MAVTRPRRALHVYVPLRYHHRPRGRDDAHSWSQPSRFLSPAARRLMWETAPAERERPGDAAAGPVGEAAARVAAQLEALWR